MLTDWAIVRRIAAELEAELSGARIKAAGLLADGRIGLRFAKQTLAIDIVAPTPFVSFVPEAAVAAQPGWSRALSESLGGLRVMRVRARPGDRLIAFDCSASSRFGVATTYRLVVELVPRFGNVLLLKDDTVVSAAREFRAGGATQRTNVRGETYEPPPLPAGTLSQAELAGAVAPLAAGDHSTTARDGAARALRGVEPLLPRLLAESLIAESLIPESLDAESHAGESTVAERLATHLCTRAAEMLAALSGEVRLTDEVFSYSDSSGKLLQAHVLPLRQFADANEGRPAALLPLVAGALAEDRTGGTASALLARRTALVARIAKRRAQLTLDRQVLEKQRDAVAERDALRRAGDLLYAHHAEVPPGATTFTFPGDAPVTVDLDPLRDAKGNAQAIFKRYKKATARAAHAGERLAELARVEDTLDELAWNAERADAATLTELSDEFARLERPKAPRAKRPAPSTPLEFPLPHGARILVGRSPQNNADLTFRIARPDDLWFHARGLPGAHVVLHLDEARDAEDGELVAAARLAAFHSKARTSEKVAVDYTPRKFVRRRPGASPGLVWYSNARTLLVSPKDGTGP